MLHYDFGNQTDPLRLTDSSGKGHHVSVTNGYKRIEYQGRKGIKLNPKSKLSIQNEKALRLSGDMTISFTFRMPPNVAAETAKRTPLIFGAAEPRAANRTYAVFWDRGNAVVLNIGSGRTYVGFSIGDLNDGKIHHVVFRIEKNRLYAYLDGELQPKSPSRVMPLDPKLGTAPICIGSWFAGTFLGELYDLRLYDEAIPTEEIGNKTER